MPPVPYLVSARLPAQPCRDQTPRLLPWPPFWFFPSCGVQAVSGSVLVMGLRDRPCSSHPPVLGEDKVAC